MQFGQLGHKLRAGKKRRRRITDTLKVSITTLDCKCGEGASIVLLLLYEIPQRRQTRAHLIIIMLKI